MENQDSAEPEPVRSNEEDAEPIATAVTRCELCFSGSLRAMESKGEKENAEVLRRLQTKFINWKAYLGIFAKGALSLDQRLKRHPQHRDLVILALDMLLMNLDQSRASCWLS